MNKNVLMVLAVIVALLAGWLVLSVAVTIPLEETEAPPSEGPAPVDSPEVRSPEQTEIRVTVVEELPEEDDTSTNITAEVTP